MLGDGNCDEECRTLECNLDNGDCGFCYNEFSMSCNAEKLGNDECDPECLTVFCDYDNDACGEYSWCN